MLTAYGLGYGSFLVGRARDSCQFDEDEPQYSEWLRGWDAAAGDTEENREIQRKWWHDRMGGKPTNS